MSAIQIFDSPEFGTLTTHKDELGREYFRAIDVSSILRLGNSSVALKRHVSEENIFQFDDGTNRAGLTNYVNEPGLYELVFKSKTPMAKKFQRWVFEEILPKLHSQGMVTVQLPGESLTDYQNRNNQLVAENKLLSESKKILETKLTSSKQHNAQIFFNLVYQKQYYSERITLKVFFEMVEIYLRNFDGKTFIFPLDRKKNILKAWGVVKGYKFIPKLTHEIDYKNDFREFMQCIANNYYTDGLGGTGELNYLQQNIDNIA